ncbi:peptide MFS transporter [Myxococcota bacterium]|nr:peptide MFS transporter [Myxococcota bacterium]
MIQGHPKGLLVAFFANMGERFGFYTMMAILVLFLQARYGLAEDDAGVIYSVFYFLIYALALLGGYIADRTGRYRRTILAGLVVMMSGYLVMSVPGSPLPVVLGGLLAIAFGNGLFKGNLQALVGQMYDDPAYGRLRDSAYSIFYMGINIGAMFAPNAARGIRNWALARQGFGYDGSLPGLCHKFLKGEMGDTAAFQDLARKVSGSEVADLSAFARNYLDAFSTGYHYAFAIAAAAMLVSLLVYVLFQRILPERGGAKGGVRGETTMSPQEEKRRLAALGLVFLVVIFFWMSFHQNGLTLTYFARDFTVKEVNAWTAYIFDIRGLISLAAMIIGTVMLVRRGQAASRRGIGLGLVAAGAAASWFLLRSYGPSNPIEAETFQQFNPFFVVFLTPVVVGFFGWLRARDREPSTPLKIGIGMLLAAVGFLVLLAGSIGLPSPADLGGGPSPERVGPQWLIGSYLILTVAELFLSPMGLSFVSKVAPPRFQGLMQGGWLGATAIGNQLLFVGSFMWVRFPLWTVWAVFVVCCLISAAFIFSIYRRLHAATSG